MGRGARAARAEWGFRVAASLLLALGIGSTVAVYAVVDGALLRPLPWPGGDRLVQVLATLGTAGGGEPGRYLVSPANFVEMRARTSTLTDLAAVRSDDLDLLGEGEPVRLEAARVTPSLFRVLEIAPRAGRLLREDDGPAVAVLSEGLWRSLFGADPEAVGRALVLDGEAREVVGVVPDRQAFPVGTQVWLPYDPGRVPETETHGGSLSVVGRLAPGRTVEDALRAMEDVAGALEALYPGNNTGRGILVEGLREPFVRDLRPVLAALMAAAGLFLVVACANVGGLVLVRMERAWRRAAVHAALGATRGRIVGLAVGRLGWVAGAGALLGVALAAVATPRLVDAAAVAVPGAAPTALDGRVLAFAATASVVALLLCAAGPAWVAGRVDPGVLLRSVGGRGAAGSRGGSRLQAALVVLQSALGVILVLTTLAALVRFRSAVSVEPGYRAEGALTVRVPVPDARYPTFDERLRFVDALREAFGTIPGVLLVGAADVLPVADPGVGWSLSVEDRPPAEPDHFEVARGRLVTPGYLEAMGVALRAGRTVLDEDGADAPPVAVVSRAFAERYWPGGQAVGRRIKRRSWNSPFPWMTVVGVVDDLREAARGDVDPGVALYLPYAQHDTRLGREMSFVLRTGGDPVSVAATARARLAEVDPRAPAIRVALLSDLLDDSVGVPRRAARLLGWFAGAALLLLALGVYGVLARAARARMREMGLRKALGARPRHVLRPFLRGAFPPLVAGAAAGSGAVVALGGAGWEGAAGGLPAWAYLAAVAVTLGAGAAACVVPAWRAAATDPAVSLRDV